MTHDTIPTDLIVVGVDGSALARPALEWAAREAEGRRAGLLLVMAQEVAQPGPHELGWSYGLEELVQQGTERVLDEAQAAVRVAHPDLEVTSQAVWGSPSAALIEASRHAQLVVTGSRGAGGWEGLLLGSVSGAVAAHAHCPVVVVPDRAAGAPADGPVVLGVDDSAEGHRAAAFAFGEADGQGVPLVAVRAWTMEFEGGVVPTEQGSSAHDEMSRRHTELVEHVLHQGREQHPEVVVEARIRRGSSVKALAEESRSASMVVVGSRGRGGFAGMLLGSTSRQVLQASHAPVAVVRV